MIKLWKQYAAGEGLTKTAGNILQKVLGLSGGTLGSSLFATLVIGIIQATGGLFGARLGKHPLFSHSKLIIYSVLFGIVASVMTLAGLIAFTYEEADVGIFVFISLFGILPGVFIDWAFFKTPLSWLQWLGVFVFLLGGYGMLDFPPLSELLVLPPWILIAFIIPIGLAINEGLMRGAGAIAASNPFVNNFWIGLTTILFAILGLFITGTMHVAAEMTIRFWALSGVIGLIILLMISFKLLAYKAGGTIAHKKIIMQGVHLVSAVLFGALFFAEPITFGKVFGVTLFFISMFLMNHSIKKYID